MDYIDLCCLCLIEQSEIKLNSTSVQLKLKYTELLRSLIDSAQIFDEDEYQELPHKICQECALKLTSFYKFKKMIDKSQTELLLKYYGIEVVNYTSESGEKVELFNDIEEPQLEQEQTDEEHVDAEETIADKYFTTLNEDVNTDFVLTDGFDGSEFIFESDNENICTDIDENMYIQIEEEIANMDRIEPEFSEEEYVVINYCESDENSVSNELHKNNYVENIKTIKQTKKIFHTSQELTPEEQLEWQHKLSKWVTKLPRGKPKQNQNGIRRNPTKKPHPCDICGRVFSSKAVVQKHQTVHTGEKNFSCEICHKKFTRSYHVKIHMRIHQGIQPYKCKTCGKGFVKSSDLSRHMRIHSENYLYKCTHCPKQFKWKASFETHISSHTGEKNFKCSICERSYTSRSSLRKHHVNIHIQN